MAKWQGDGFAQRWDGGMVGQWDGGRSREGPCANVAVLFIVKFYCSHHLFPCCCCKSMIMASSSSVYSPRGQILGEGEGEGGMGNDESKDKGQAEEDMTVDFICTSSRKY